MGKVQDRIAITNNIIDAAREYKAHMVGKTFLYVFEGQFIEVLYRTRDFLHLTGVDTQLSAESFYKKAVDGTLRSNQVFFSQRHPYDLCLRKNQFIQQLKVVTDSEILILRDIQTNTARFQFGVTELSFVLCLDQIKTLSGEVKSDLYIARSLRAEDGFARSAEAYEVNYIFKKKNNEKQYGQIMYSDGKIALDTLPDEIQKKLLPSTWRRGR